MRRRRNKQLSPREYDVLRFLAAGYNNREIAGKLIIEQCTVQTHVTRILDKLDAINRMDAVIVALREKRITIEDIPELED